MPRSLHGGCSASDTLPRNSIFGNGAQRACRHYVVANVNPACLTHSVPAPDELVTFCSVVSVQPLLWYHAAYAAEGLLRRIQSGWWQ